MRLVYLRHMFERRFHAYAVVMELDTYEVNDNPDVSTRQSNVILKKKTYGGVPAGAGMREDVILVFEELEEARNALIQVQEIIASMPDPRASIGKNNPRPVFTSCRPYTSRVLYWT